MDLQYLIREPKIKLAQNPLLLLVHGYGSNEADLFSFATELPEEYYVISLRAPYDLGYGSYAWYAINPEAGEKKFSDMRQAASSRDLIVKSLDELTQKYAIDSNNITLVGFSQGAILSYAVALSYPQKVRKVVAMSGYLHSEMALEGYAQNDFSNLSIFASHGSADQVVPVDWARKAKPLLDSLGIKNVYKEYPIGHGVSPQNFFDFRDWLQNG